MLCQLWGFFVNANAKLLKTHVNIQFYPNNILWSACFVPFDHLFPSFPLVRLLVKWSFYKSNISNSKSHWLKDRSLKRTKVLTRIRDLSRTPGEVSFRTVCFYPGRAILWIDWTIKKAERWVVNKVKTDGPRMVPVRHRFDHHSTENNQDYRNLYSDN